MSTVPVSPPPVAVDDELSLEIVSLSHNGVGLARVDNWVIMVPFALPGERVSARVWRNHKNYSEADLLAVIQPSPERVEPRCALFGRCGGCQYQQLNYPQQLEWKRRHVGESLKRLAGIDTPVEPVFPSPQPYAYRSKITPHFRRPPHSHPDIPIGFQGSSGRRIIDVPECPIATEAINKALPEIRQNVRAGIGRRFKRGGTLLLRDTLDGVIEDPGAIVSERVGKWMFQFPAGEFFQNNPFILPSLVDHVVEEARGVGQRYLVDAYCGVGVFGIAAAQHFEHCAGVEVSAASINWARANALINHIDNITFHLGKAESLFAELDFCPEATSLLIDPPRRGCDSDFLNQLFAFGPKKVVYVSCAPETQARDLKEIIDRGYHIKSVQPFDLFPQTRHIETVVSLEKTVGI